jgi:hypothetical protein
VHGRARLWKVAVDVTPMEQADNGYGLIFHQEPKSVIAYPNTVVGALVRQVLHIWEICQRRALLELFN